MFDVPKTLLQHCSKESFHRSGARFLRGLAIALGLERTAFEVRSSKGGPAVMGEVILHSSFIYIQLFMDGDKPRLLYRTCNGRKDYYGGPNLYVWLDSLVDDGKRQYLVILKRMSEQSRQAQILAVPKSQPNALVA